MHTMSSASSSSSSSPPSPPLPSDIIFKILTGTTLETLDTCKVVRKEWRDMIFESSFMPQFCARSQNISGYFCQCLFFSYHVSNFVSMDGCSGNSTTTPFHLPIDERVMPQRYSDMRIVASSMQGILCCVRRVNRVYRFHICKPSTKQWVKLPNPRTRNFTKKVALIVLRSKPLHFKIIRLSSPRTNYRYYMKVWLMYYRCEIFDSECWEWRRGNDLLFPPESCLDTFAPAVHAGGLIYLKLYPHNVLALNYDGEIVVPRFSLPNPSFDDEYKDHHRCYQLLEYKGKLGCTCLTPKGMKLWVFDNGKKDWELSKEVDIETVKGVAKYAIPRGFYNADIAVMSEYNRVIFYKLQDKSFEVVQLKKGSAEEIFPFRSDLEPMDLRMPGANIVSSTRHLYLPSWISLVIVFMFLFGIFLLFSHA